jgi:CxxC motif-containing protein (DUF1111 family)
VSDPLNTMRTPYTVARSNSALLSNTNPLSIPNVTVNFFGEQWGATNLVIDSSDGSTFYASAPLPSSFSKDQFTVGGKLFSNQWTIDMYSFRVQPVSSA